MGEQIPFVSKIDSDSFDKLIVLHAFYTISRRDNIQERKSETDMLRGIGKKSLCAVFSILIDNSDNTMVMLESSGGDVQTEEDHQSRGICKGDEKEYREDVSKKVPRLF